jgi:hypothetical protein
LRLALLGLGACITPSGCNVAAPNPSSRDVQQLETTIVLPSGAKPLHSYLRTYWLMRSSAAGEMKRGCSNDLAIPPNAAYPLVRGRFVTDVISHRTGVRLSRRAPGACDGGCRVVEVIYDPRLRRVLGVRCNPEL